MDIDFLIITGISGAGKSQTIKCLEDMGFFCVDNLPVLLLTKFADLCIEVGGRLRRVALGIDIREGQFLSELSQALAELRQRSFSYRIIFLDAREEVLVRRFSETRRRHPLGQDILAGIREERRRLEKLKGESDRIIDTTDFTITGLKELISRIIPLKKVEEINIQVVSFGYKFGLPPDVDIVMDVRFLPNPNYVPRLQKLTGNQPAVKRYLLAHPLTRRFLQRFQSFLSFLIPHYVKEGKCYLTIGIGCTGGHHRSVFIANQIEQFLRKRGFYIKVYHRDINR